MGRVKATKLKKIKLRLPATTYVDRAIQKDAPVMRTAIAAHVAIPILKTKFPSIIIHP